MFGNFNIKKLVIWLLVVMVSAFGIAGLVFVSGGADIGFIRSSDGPDAAVINTEKEAKIDNISEVIIQSVSSNVKVTPYDGNVVKAHFYGSTTGARVPELSVDSSGKTLKIEIRYPTKISFGYYAEDLKLDIQVPKNFENDVNIKNVSGKIDISGFKLNNLTAVTVSGEIESGDIEAAENIRLETVSGYINYVGASGSISAQSVSGKIDIEQSKLTDDISLKTTSGDTTIRVPDGSEFEYTFKTTSGSMKNDFTAASTTSKRSSDGKVGSGGSSISVQTVSGDFNLRKFSK